MDHVYQIGKYEVTAGQYTEFLNAVADADPNGLYNTAMGDQIGPYGANIQRTDSSPNYSYSVASEWADRPVNYVSFWDAARFANWLHNNQPTGAQGPGTTEDGAYHDVGDQTLFGRNAGARSFIPTEDEWYKAAYHDQTAGLAASYFDYPTGTSAVPGYDITEATNPGNNANWFHNLGPNSGFAIGAPYYRTDAGEFELSDSPYGTFDQGGNVSEWNETSVTSSYRGSRGGSFRINANSLHAFTRSFNRPSVRDFIRGFRVASIIPEPSTLLLLCFGSLAVLWPRRGLVCASILAAVVCAATSAQAVTIDTVPVGNPGNAGDVQSNGTFGAVPYAYRIGKIEVTNAQYVEFLNGVAASDPYELYNFSMGDCSCGGITRSGSSGSYTYAVKADALGQGPGGTDYSYGDKPVGIVSWYSSIRFANWLHNGMGSGDTENGAYTLLGGTPMPSNGNSITRNSVARWWLPSEDEWYKAAYFDPSGVYYDYPTATNSVPNNNLPSADTGNSANYYTNNYTTGRGIYNMTDAGAYALSDSPYGTFDQGGNVWEWNETLIVSSSRGLRGGSWFNPSGLHASIRNLNDPSGHTDTVGFRVASIPEPSTLLLLCFGSLAVLWRRRRVVCATILAAAVGIIFVDRASAVTIDMVTVGNPGNPGDVQSNGTFGSVPYSYRIGKHEVTNAQYVEFLNGVDLTGANALALYDAQMSSTARGGINFNGGAANGSKYEIKPGRDNNPVVFVSWYDSIRFANWLHNGQGSGDTEDGAYTLLGGTPTPSNGLSTTRNTGAQWWLPSENEWYKAAYHKNDGVTGNYWDYPTSTDAIPYSDQPPGSGAPDQSNTANFFKDDGVANGYDDGYAVTGSTSFNTSNYLTDVGAYTLSASPYGTFDQGGNVVEWSETVFIGDGTVRGLRGGQFGSIPFELKAFYRSSNGTAAGGLHFIGFRVASNIPEPSTLLLVGLAGSCCVMRRRR